MECVKNGLLASHATTVSGTLTLQVNAADAPPPNVLQQLGIPQGRVNDFYRPPQPPQAGLTDQPRPFSIRPRNDGVSPSMM